MPIYKRSGSPYWWIKIYPPGGGQPIRRSTGTASRRDAQAFERRVVDELNDQFSRQLRGIPDQVTWDQVLIRYLEEHQPSQTVQWHLDVVLPYLRGRNVTESLDIAREFRTDQLKSGKSPLTVNRRLAIVRMLLNRCYREWRLIDEPLGEKLKGLFTSELAYARHRYFTPEEIEKVLGQIKRDDVRDCLLVLVYTGLRVRELLTLTPDRFSAGYIRLEAANTKTRRPRVIPVPEALHRILETRLPFEINYSVMRSHWRKACKRAGVQDARIHDLRHTYASWLAADPNVPFTVIRDVLGHTNISTTNRYSHVRTETLKTVLNSLPKVGTKNE